MRKSARFWSAVAKRGGDTAFARSNRFRIQKPFRPLKSAVAAITLPSHSET